jgi:hypothetical protein
MTEETEQKISMRMEENSKRKTRKGAGRKPKTDPAVHRYVVRLNSEENGHFEILFQKSGLKQHSKFIKAMIFGREMKVVRIDKAAMDYYIRLTNFYHQFQARFLEQDFKVAVLFQYPVNASFQLSISGCLHYQNLPLFRPS